MIPEGKQEQRNSKDTRHKRWWPRHVRDHETTYPEYTEKTASTAPFGPNQVSRTPA